LGRSVEALWIIEMLD